MRHPRRSVGIRVRVTALTMLAVAGTLALSGVAVVLMTRQALLANVDSAAESRTADVIALARAGPLPSTIPAAADTEALVQVVGPGGRVLAASSNIAGEGAVLSRVPWDRTAVTRTLPSSPLGDASLRVLATPIRVGSTPAWVYVATSVSQVNAAVDTLGALFVAGLPLLSAVLGWTIWRAAGAALRPLDAIRARATRISAADLSQRVPVPGGSDEAARLATTMNEMLARIEDAAVRQQQFVGDASHELRSPLTALQAQLEVALAHPTDVEVEPLLRTALDQTTRMARLIDGLLFLARTGEEAARPAPGAVDLDELVLAEAHRLQAISGLRIRVTSVTAVRVPGSASDLARLLRNLGDNGVDHARSTIELALVADGANAVISVTDDGPGIAREGRERIFHRFTRLDGSRARHLSGGGSGLGLAIATRIAQAHGGALSVEDRPDGRRGARFVFRLPRTGTDVDASDLKPTQGAGVARGRGRGPGPGGDHGVIDDGWAPS